MPVTIKRWDNGEAIATVEDTDDLREAAIRLVKKGVSLNGANLNRANLDGANLNRANLNDSTRIETGETWKEYREEVLPLLCVMGGKSLAEVAGAWECHEWSNCPMHAAFDFDGQVVPQSPAMVKLLRPRIEQFVRLFDAKLLPPTVLPWFPQEAVQCAARAGEKG